MNQSFRGAAPIGDTYTMHGAGVLAAKVQGYWHARGHTNVRVERVQIGEGTSFWGLRSNLVNGLPPRQ